MGIETALLIGALAMSAVGTFASIQSANTQKKAAQAAAEANFNLQNQELTRQQAATNEAAAKDKSDVVRRADAELGTLRVAGAEAGASGSSFLRMVNELGYVEGTDLSRIESNRSNTNASLQASKVAAKQGAQNQTTLAYNRGNAQITQSVIGFAGSALQIGASYQHNANMEEIARNKRTV